MSKENDSNNTPNEIPLNKTPHTSNPVKDPSMPSENNPINPKTDEPIGK